MKSLILSDIHLKIDRAQRIINYEGADKVIFLGDIFDDFHDTPAQNAKAAEWLNDFVDKPNHIWVLANHDQQYITKFNSSFICSGYDKQKQKAIQSVLRNDILEKFKYFYFHEGVLFTHAGLHNSHIPKHDEFSIQDVSSWLESESKNADKVLQGISQRHWFFEAGYCRGGRSPFGGLTWCDFYREFLHVFGLTQIVGHSPNKHPSIKVSDEFVHKQAPNILDIDGAWSLGLDTHLNHYATIENKQLTIKKYSDL